MKKLVISLLAMLLIAAMLMGSAMAAAYVETTGNVYVRSGPGLGYTTLGTVNKGTTLTYQNQYFTDDRGVVWYMVLYKNSNAWVSSTYADLYGASIATYLYATDGDSYLRNAPNLNGKILDTFQEGNSAQYLNASSVDERGVTWYRVSYNGKTGWVSARYTTFNLHERAVYATKGDSKIRNAPNLNGEVLGYLYEGKTATYMEVSSIDNRGVAWYQIKIDGVLCWVSSMYTEIY